MATDAEIDRIRRETDIVALVGSSVKLARKGRLFWGLCPFHKEKSPSFKVDNERRRYHCFGCGAGGDALDWLQKTRNLTFAEALNQIGGQNINYPEIPESSRPAPEKKTAKPVPIMPVPADAPPPDFRHAKHGAPAATWRYADAADLTLGYVCRFDLPGGGKEVLPLVWTASGWRWQGFPRPRPLYGLAALAARPDAPVLIVEGEKSADAAQTLLPDYVAVTWCGGTGAVKHADWSPLAGRAVTIWPDADEPGYRAAAEISAILAGIGATLAPAIRPPEGAAKGWDAADALAEGVTAEAILSRRAGDTQDRPEHAPADGGERAEPGDDITGPPPGIDPDAWPFRSCGHNGGVYYYLPRAAGTVIQLSGAAHTSGGLLMLAPLQFWEERFGAGGKTGWLQAANALIRASEREGIFDPSRFRGCGAWVDRARIVLHFGDRLVVDGVETPLSGIGSHYLYAADRTMPFRFVSQVSSARAGKFLDLCKRLKWERPLSAYLLAGWCALAPICGGLRWRPHIWLTGQSHSGKSWVFNQIVTRACEPLLRSLMSSTTEAGIRRDLKCSALPVAIDEFESRDAHGLMRVKSILHLARAASTETNAVITMASAHGGTETFRIRSMFCFSSIGVSAQDQADVTRISVLTLKASAASDETLAHFAALEDAQSELMTDDYVAGLQSRMISLLPTVRRNAEIFSKCGAKILGTKRLGDQIGTLLAGAFALTSSKIITPEAATKWIEEQDWSEEKDAAADTDAPGCLARILEYQVAVETSHGQVRRSLHELVEIARGGGEFEDPVSRKVASSTLLRHGISVTDADYLAISNTHSAIGAILRDTPWAVHWSRRLKTLPESILPEAPVYFGGGTSRAVMVRA